MSNTSNPLKNKTKITLITFLIMTALAILARGASYFYSELRADIIYMNTALPVVFDYVSRLSDVIQMFIGYALVAYYTITGGIKNALFPFILTAVASFMNYLIVGVLNLIVSTSVKLLPLTLYLLANYATELFRLAIVAAIAFVAVKIMRSKNNYKVRSISPFASPFNVTAFLAAIIVVMGKALIEFFNETIPFIEYFDSYDISTIIITYLIIVVNGVLGYFIAHFTTAMIAHATGTIADVHNDI